MKILGQSRKWSAGRLWARLVGSRVHAALQPHFSAVEQCDTTLADAIRKVEERFLEVGALLEQVTTTERDLLAQGDAFIRLTTGQDAESPVDSAGRHISDAIQFIERHERSMHGLAQHLESVQLLIARTLAAEQTLTRTLDPLKNVQTLFRVETARLPVETQEMFLALVAEIDRIRSRIEGVFREKFETIRTIRTILVQAIRRLADEQQRDERAVVIRREQMEQSLATVRAGIQQSLDCARFFTEVSGSISAETGRVVMSLQAQDMIAQKLQHANTALSEMAANHTTLRSSSKEDMGQSLHFIAKAGCVVGAQLDAMQSELTGAGQAIEAGCHQIGRHLDKLKSECRLLQQSRGGGALDISATVQVLLDSLADTRRLVDETGHHAEAAHQAIQPIGGTATNFTEFIREFSLEIHLIGLNAEIQATHVGAGTGLVVLSACASEISRETSQLSLSLSTELDGLSRELEQVVGAFRTIRDENAAYLRTLSEVGSTHEAALQAYRTTALQMQERIQVLLPQLQEQTALILNLAGLGDLATTPIRALHEAVSALETAAQSAASRFAAGPVGASERLEQLVSRYTMRSEVNVHREALENVAQDIRPKASDDPARTPTPETASASSLPEVDLWLDAPSAPVPQTTSH